MSHPYRGQGELRDAGWARELTSGEPSVHLHVESLLAKVERAAREGECEVTVGYPDQTLRERVAVRLKGLGFVASHHSNSKWVTVRW